MKLLKARQNNKMILKGNYMKFITLNNGVKMPILGFGVYQISKEDCERCVLDAIIVGYRHIDTAQAYFSEEEVGNAIIKSGLKRESIFITTKVWIDNYGYEKTKQSILNSLKKLKTTYIDLVLLHQPFCDYHAAWRALEDLYMEGVIKAIGVSNFYPDRFVDLTLSARIKPMVNQIETNPFFQREEDNKWLTKYECVHESWASFAEGRNNIFKNQTIKSIGDKYHKTIAQVILRWLIQRNIVVIPKSTHVERMKENFNVFDFELSDEDMEKMKTIEENNSQFFSHENPKIVEWFYTMVNR